MAWQFFHHLSDLWPALKISTTHNFWLTCWIWEGWITTAAGAGVLGLLADFQLTSVFIHSYSLVYEHLGFPQFCNNLFRWKWFRWHYGCLFIAQILIYLSEWLFGGRSMYNHRMKWMERLARKYSSFGQMFYWNKQMVKLQTIIILIIWLVGFTLAGCTKETTPLLEYTLLTDKSYEDASSAEIIREILVSPNITK